LIQVLQKQNLEKDSRIAWLENTVQNLTDELQGVKNAENEQNHTKKNNAKLQKSIVYMMHSQDDLESNNINMQNMIMHLNEKEEK
jgi:hypothetical protein